MNELLCKFIKYCRLHRSYEALSGGKIHDAICDMTGATGEFINLEKITQPRAHLFQSMIRLYRMDSLMGCSIEVCFSFFLACGLN